MIKKLRRQFVLTTMGILLVVFACILTGLNIVFKELGERQQLDILKDIATSEQIPKASGQNKRPPHFDYMPVYTFKLDESNQIISSDSSLEGNDIENIESILRKAIDHKKKDGHIENYEYFKTDKPYGSFIVLVDSSNSVADSYNNRLLSTTISIGVVGLIIIFGASIFLSRFVVKPAEDTFNKQKRFISDASHELKTPLATIAVNANLVADELKDNKHMKYILSEVNRMDGLIKQLLDISRLDDNNYKINKARFNISEALYSIVLPLESIAFERNIELNIKVQNNVEFDGDMISIKQLFAILVDNAFKYVNEKGQVSITLSTVKNKIEIEVYNTGEGINDNDLPHIFERFYRVDSSRAKPEGSYGLGLAIAKSILEKHGGKIDVNGEYEKWICFKVIL